MPSCHAVHKMPLCLMDQLLNKMEHSCYMEHKISDDPDIGCNEINRRHKKIPKEKQVCGAVYC